MTARRRRQQGYSVGISIFVGPDGDLGLYENGLRQNVIFLYQLFRAAPGCARVWLLNHGDGEFAGWPPELGMDDVPVVRTGEVIEDLDYVIVIGAAIDPGQMRRLRALGIAIIAYKGGNGAVISMEAMIAKPPRADAERYVDADLYDAIWMTPQHIATYAGWCRTVYRVPVHEVPQIWAATFVDCRSSTLRQPFGYRPGSKRWRLGIMEPNITVMKTAHVAMLVCEAAYRRNPEMIDCALVSNTARHRNDPHFTSFARALDIVRSGTMTFESRFVSANFLAEYCDAIVTHHWENGLNYLYYEALYGGYPLIHNSHFLREYGYYYSDFGAESGGDALIDAMHLHDRDLDAYNRNVRQLLTQLSPTNTKTIELHDRLLTSMPLRPSSN